MSRHPRVRRILLLAAALALPLALVPATTASAADPVPVFSYIDTTSGPYARVFSSSTADGSNPVALTPAGYQTFSYDVTPDGATELVGLCHGTPVACLNKVRYGYLDVTWGLLLVHHDPVYGTRSRVLTTWWDSYPALTASGAAVWMTGSTLYRFVPDYSTAAWTSAGTFDTSTAFAPMQGYYTNALAVSADGTKVAVLQWHESTPHYGWRLLAGDFATGEMSASCFRRDRSAESWEPDPSTFTFVDDSHLLLSTSRFADSPRIDVGGYQEWPLYSQIATLGGVDVGQCFSALTANPALDNTYDVKPFGATWYVWYNVAGAPSAQVSYGTTSDVTVRPSTWTARSGGPTDIHYVPSSVTPPAIADPADNLAAAHPNLRLGSSLVAYNKRALYEVANLYYQAPAAGPYDADEAAEVDVGTLQYSTDAGRTWLTATTTTGLHVVKIGSSYYNGSTQRLRRNTWFRWVYAGDLLTAAGSTSTRLVRVAPAISVKVAKSGRSRIVYGSATREGGRIALYRATSRGYRYVATATMTSKGTFTFGKRKLARGTYKVVSLADTSWAASTKVFKV